MPITIPPFRDFFFKRYLFLRDEATPKGFIHTINFVGDQIKAEIITPSMGTVLVHEEGDMDNNPNNPSRVKISGQYILDGSNSFQYNPLTHWAVDELFGGISTDAPNGKVILEESGAYEFKVTSNWSWDGLCNADEPFTAARATWMGKPNINAYAHTHALIGSTAYYFYGTEARCPGTQPPGNTYTTSETNFVYTFGEDGYVKFDLAVIGQAFSMHSLAVVTVNFTATGYKIPLSPPLP